MKVLLEQAADPFGRQSPWFSGAAGLSPAVCHCITKKNRLYWVDAEFPASNRYGLSPFSPTAVSHFFDDKAGSSDI